VYTESMQNAFRSLDHFCPKGFNVELVDNDHFITVRAPEKLFFNLSHDDKIRAVEYMIRVKKALEDNGAVVLILRKSMG
jgi:hypothetical protein